MTPDSKQSVCTGWLKYADHAAKEERWDEAISNYGQYLQIASGDTSVVEKKLSYCIERRDALSKPSHPQTSVCSDAESEYDPGEVEEDETITVILPKKRVSNGSSAKRHSQTTEILEWADLTPAEQADVHSRLLQICNTGKFSEIQQIPSIGPQRCAAIIDYRTENGKFSDVSIYYMCYIHIITEPQLVV